MICGVCEKECEFHTTWSDAHRQIVRVVAENQKEPRAMYFDSEHDVDFCSHECSLIHYQKKMEKE